MKILLCVLLGLSFFCQLGFAGEKKTYPIARKVNDKNYYAKVYNAINEVWKIYKPKLSDENIEARIWLVIDKTGDIKEFSFEKKSDVKQFDKMIIKTIADYEGIPIPNDMGKDELEIGLSFKN